MRSDFVWVTEDAKTLTDLLIEVLPKRIDGKDAVDEMRSAGCRNWRQMEWPGFWVECRVEQHLTQVPGLSKGPTYGNVEFDLARKCVWDLKTHSESGSSLTPLNDQEAILDCIRGRGGIGYLIVNGVPTPDDDGSFKRWHDIQKGKKSAYVRSNEARGVPSRTRKASFEFTKVQCLWIDEPAVIHEGVASGWLTTFQSGMRNSNGKLRRPKYLLDLKKIPESLVVREQPIPGRTGDC